MRLILMLALCACEEPQASVYGDLESAEIHVDSAHLGDLAGVQVKIWLYALHGKSDAVVLQGGWLDGDSGTLVAQLGLALPKPVSVAPGLPAAVELVNRSVTNGSLIGLCDLQLDLGVTVSGLHDRERNRSLGFPVKIDCN